jgi:hypothetical protein
LISSDQRQELVLKGPEHEDSSTTTTTTTTTTVKHVA